jgi:hypothetical protein
MKDRDLESALEHAASLGTLGKIDRSAQYEDQRYDSTKLLRNDNLLFQRMRMHERYKLLTAIITIVLGAIVGNLQAILSFFHK